MIFFSWAKYPGEELLDCMAVLFFLVFCETLVLLFTVAVPIYIPTKVYEASLFFTYSTTFVICVLFANSHSGWCEVTSHSDFYFHFLMISDIKHLFMCLLAIWCPLWENVILIFFQNFIIGLLVLFCFFFFYVELDELFIYFGYKPLSVTFLNIFSHTVGCLFILSVVSFAVQKSLSLTRSLCSVLLLFPLL